MSTSELLTPEDRAAEHAAEKAQFEADTETAFKLEQGFKAAIGRAKASLWDVAKWAYECNEANVYLYMQPHENGMSTRDARKAWLAQPEIDMSESHFIKLVGIWDQLVTRRGLTSEDLAGIDVSKAEVIIPRLRSGTILKKEALADARDLTVAELRAKYLSPKEPPAPADPIIDADYHPAETLETDPGPVRADTIEAVEVVSGEVVAESVPFEYPGWITPDVIERCHFSLQAALDSDSPCPRVEREAVEVADQLLQAWQSMSTVTPAA